MAQSDQWSTKEWSVSENTSQPGLLSRQGTDLVAQGDHLISKLSQLFGPCHFSIGTIGVAAHEEGGKRRGHVAENTQGIQRQKDAQYATLSRLRPVA